MSKPLSKRMGSTVRQRPLSLAASSRVSMSEQGQTPKRLNIATHPKNKPRRVPGFVV